MLPQSMIVTGMKRNERTYYKLFSNTKASKIFFYEYRYAKAFDHSIVWDGFKKIFIEYCMSFH